SPSATNAAALDDLANHVPPLRMLCHIAITRDLHGEASSWRHVEAILSRSSNSKNGNGLMPRS
ncbi:MAG: hypothetical protein ACXW6J_25650, partial [Candidatus Binatia bacterium]